MKSTLKTGIRLACMFASLMVAGLILACVGTHHVTLAGCLSPVASLLTIVHLSLGD